MSANVLLKELKQGKYAPVYVLHGEEAYYIDTVSDYIEEHALQEHEKSFNQTILYGKDVDFKAVIDSARRYPMMAERQVVILKEAQQMRDLDKLETYIANPMPSTILVICHKHKKIDGRGSLSKAIKAHSVVLEATPLRDYQVAEWVTTYLDERDLKITQAGAQLIAEYLGTDLHKVANALDKLAINLPKGGTVTPELIETHVGISKDYNIFELQNALLRADNVRCWKIIRYFGENEKEHPAFLVVAMLFSFFSKVYVAHFMASASDAELASAMGMKNAWGVKDYRAAVKQFSKVRTEYILSLLKEYDLKTKGVDSTSNTSSEALLTELMFKILSFQA